MSASEYVVLVERHDGRRFQLTMGTHPKDEAEKFARNERARLRAAGYVPGYTVTVEKYTRDEAVSAEYAAADAEMSVATAKFSAVRTAYRAGTATDDEYLAARAEHVIAVEKFDAAFIAERDRA
jgi:hypothetical protein